MLLQSLPQLNSLNLPWPTFWPDIFGVDRPLILEIGFGYGQYLQHLHRIRPDASIIGLEINHTCIVKAERAIPRKGLDNVRVIHTTAETALHHLFMPTTISEIHINFPDPWFKERHSGRRLMQRDTLDAMVNRLLPGGMLYLATDILAYAEMASELLVDTPALDNQFDTPWVYEMPGRTITKYENKAQAVGRPCHYFAYRRNHQPGPDVPVIKEQPMPHVVFSTPLDLDNMFDAFNVAELIETTYTIAELRINMKGLYRGHNSLLFDLFVHEPTIDQRVSLILAAQEDNPHYYTLKLGAIGNPRPTEGIHAAVRILADKLVSLHPQTIIIHDKVRSQR